MKEIYKDIEGFEGLYQVSNLGNVLSLNYLNQKHPKILKPIRHHLGYQMVHLRKDCKTHIKMIHVLVAKAFIPNPDKKPIVNHIDGNKAHNTVDNLEWVTYKENTQHAIRIGIHDPKAIRPNRGKDNANSKPILQYSLDGEFIKRWDCISDASRYIGCNPCMLINNASGRIKTAKGYVWKYSTD